METHHSSGEAVNNHTQSHNDQLKLSHHYGNGTCIEIIYEKARFLEGENSTEYPTSSAMWHKTGELSGSDDVHFIG